MHMKAQLENLLMSAKSVTAFRKTWLFSWWSKQGTFLFIECWKNKYAKECLFLKGFKTPCYFCLFLSQDLRTFNKRESEMFYCFVCSRRSQAVAKKCGPICPPCGVQRSLILPCPLATGRDEAGCIHFASWGNGREAWALNGRERPPCRWLAQASSTFCGY